MPNVGIVRKLTRMVLVGALALSASLLGAQSASADDYGTLPPGCSLSPRAPIVSGATIVYGGTGYCTSTNVTLFILQLVHNYDLLPDAVAAQMTQSPAAKPFYDLTGVTCDGGGVTEYYVQTSYWATTGDSGRASPTVTLSHC